MENASFEEFRDEKAVSEPSDIVQNDCIDLLTSYNTIPAGTNINDMEDPGTMHCIETLPNEDNVMINANKSIVSKESSRITMTPNSKSLIGKNPIKKDLMRIEATPMKQQSHINFIKIHEDYWKSDTGWTCYFCEASFKFEIAFKNPLKIKKKSTTKT